MTPIVFGRWACGGVRGAFLGQAQSPTDLYLNQEQNAIVLEPTSQNRYITPCLKKATKPKPPSKT
jgi:hypothetical protein